MRFEGIDMQAWPLLLDELERLPCKTVFVRLPLQGKKPEQKRQADLHPRFQQQIVADLEARGFAYYDLNRPPYPEDELYYKDPGHMNATGRNKTTRLFTRYVLFPLLFPDLEDREPHTGYAIEATFQKEQRGPGGRDEAPPGEGEPKQQDEVEQH